jgi:hypothetical protein
LGGGIPPIKKCIENAGSASEEIGLEVNPERTR